MFDLLEKMYIEMQERFDGVNKEIAGINKEIAGINKEIAGINKEVIGINKEVIGINKEIIGINQKMEEGFNEVNTRIEYLETEVKETKNKVIIAEQEQGKKLDVLFDGYKQNADKLDRIEKEVSKHEEVILRRIR